MLNNHFFSEACSSSSGPILIRMAEYSRLAVTQAARGAAAADAFLAVYTQHTIDLYCSIVQVGIRIRNTKTVYQLFH
jgi:hypothetical protein